MKLFIALRQNGVAHALLSLLCPMKLTPITHSLSHRSLQRAPILANAAARARLSSNSPGSDRISVDSGASHTCVHNPSLITHMQPSQDIIQTASASGNIRDLHAGTSILKTYLRLIPTFLLNCCNLLSVPQIVHHGFEVVHSQEFGHFTQPSVAGQCPICHQHPQRVCFTATPTDVYMDVPRAPSPAIFTAQSLSKAAQAIQPCELFPDSIGHKRHAAAATLQAYLRMSQRTICRRPFMPWPNKSSSLHPSQRPRKHPPSAPALRHAWAVLESPDSSNS